MLSLFVPLSFSWIRLVQDLCDKVLKEVGKMAQVAGKCMKEAVEF